MPKEYEAIRDNLVKRGKSMDDAQKHAAMIYNSRHPDTPVHGKHKAKKKKKSKRDLKQSDGERKNY